MDAQAARRADGFLIGLIGLRPAADVQVIP
jgi:hypothetical protein